MGGVPSGDWNRPGSRYVSANSSNVGVYVVVAASSPSAF